MRIDLKRVAQINRNKIICFFAIFLVFFLYSLESSNASFWDNLVGRAYNSEYSDYDQEKITCKFGNSNVEQTCYSRKGQCTGKGECSVEVTGKTGEKLTWQNTCSDEYSYTSLDGQDKEITFTCDSLKTESVKCVFEESDSEHICTSQYGSCSGVEYCSININAALGERILWNSDCGGFAYNTQDGTNEQINFQCGSTVSEKVICNFLDKSQEQVCFSKYGSCKGKERCIITVTGTKGERLIWQTTLGEKASTLMDGKNEYANFEEGPEQISEEVVCNFPIDGTLYSCTSDIGEGQCSEEMDLTGGVYSGECTASISGEEGTNIVWQSNVPRSINQITKIDGINEEIYFNQHNEDCINKLDDDYDGKTDCTDSDCFGYIDSEKGLICTGGYWYEYSCQDTIDNDKNGFIDCADLSNCKNDEICNYPEGSYVEGICEDEFDNDGDGLIDDQDVECRQPAFILKPTEGYAGQSFEIIGNNLVGESVSLSFGWGYLTEISLDEKGHFEVTENVPEMEQGLYTISIDEYPELRKTFMILPLPDGPEFSIMPLAGEAGSEVTFIGKNFPVGEYEITLDNSIVARAITSISGDFFGSFSVPENSVGERIISVAGYPKIRQIFNVQPSSPDMVKEQITCLFDDGSEEEQIVLDYTCRSDSGDSCTGQKSCSILVSGYQEKAYSWQSTVPDTSASITSLDGIDETIVFRSPKYYEAYWECNDGYEVTSAVNPEALTKQKWLNDYIEPSCEIHGGLSNSYGFVTSSEEPVSLIGKAFRSIFEETTITEQVTCVFDKKDDSLSECYSEKGRCSGINECSFLVSGVKDESFSVRSTIINSDAATITIDGIEENIIFSESLQTVIDQVTCIFIQSEEMEQTCFSDNGKAQCSGTVSCITLIEGYINEAIIWQSTVIGSSPVETVILGNEKYLEFVEDYSVVINDTINKTINKTINETYPEQELINASINKTWESEILPEINYSSNYSINEEYAGEESTIPEDPVLEEPDVVIPEDEESGLPGKMMYSFSWECQDNYKAEAKYILEQDENWWIHESMISCTSHGSTPKEEGQTEPIYSSEETPIGGITGNAAYQPDTYAGWILYQIGILG